MAYLPVSAFQRPMTLVQLEQAKRSANLAPSLASVPKWALFRALVKAKEHFALNARDLALLQGLLTFHPHEELEAGKDLILFPSNKTICERMNGMADSTMRRHLRRLIAAGLLLRRDSCNGKRFSVSHCNEPVAFGLDLAPLLYLSSSILQAAEEADAATGRSRQLRLEVQLMRRDLYALLPLLDAETAERMQIWWHEVTRMLRRKLPNSALQQLHKEHEAAISHLKATLLTNSDIQNEQHNLNSNIKYLESEKDVATKTSELCNKQTRISLEQVIKACPQIEVFYDAPVRHWEQLIDASRRLYKAIGISHDAYRNAEKWLGFEQTAVVVAAMLQRFERIRSPGAYLHHLVQKAVEGKFSCRPMIMALLT